ncbi:SMI1/KNR4 family protein [Leptolyngbya sp. AN03gr2]|uniref:SMI1/KNR4 family protein n=1 Tax=unclassified Leptolyngbya TaxID=2650499 RepID=UPI003D313FAE
MSTRLERWKSLLEQVEVKLNTLAFNLTTLTIVSAEDLAIFESLLNIMLPLGYKEFCQTFGEGSFGQGFICIDCPNVEHFKIQAKSNTEIIEACKSSFREAPLTQALLNHAYLFGLGSGTLLVFDLNTYESNDRSYDIYAIDENGDAHQIGRDFYNFVTNFCLGTELETKFPLLASTTMGYDRQEPRNQFTATQSKWVLD